MYRPKLLLVAQGISLDATSNNVSVFSILDEIRGVAFPLFVAGGFSVLSIAERDPDDPPKPQGRLRIEISGKTLEEVSLNIDFRDRRRHRAITTLTGIVLPQPGTLKIAVSMAGEPLHEYTIDVERIGGVEVKQVETPPA